MEKCTNKKAFVVVKAMHTECPVPWRVSSVVTSVQCRDKCPVSWKVSSAVTSVQCRDNCPVSWRVSSVVTSVQCRDKFPVPCPVSWQVTMEMYWLPSNISVNFYQTRGGTWHMTVIFKCRLIRNTNHCLSMYKDNSTHHTDTTASSHYKTQQFYNLINNKTIQITAQSSLICPSGCVS
jgi:hypothetical protein